MPWPWKWNRKKTEASAVSQSNQNVQSVNFGETAEITLPPQNSQPVKCDKSIVEIYNDLIPIHDQMMVKHDKLLIETPKLFGPTMVNENPLDIFKFSIVSLLLASYPSEYTSTLTRGTIRGCFNYLKNILDNTTLSQEIMNHIENEFGKLHSHRGGSKKSVRKTKKTKKSRK